MAESLALLVTPPHTKRGPSGGTYTTIYTATQQAAVEILVCNTAAASAKFRIAVIEAGSTYVDGTPPGNHQYIVFDRELQAAPDDYVTPTFNIDAGVRLVVMADISGVTFLPNGILVD